MFRSSLAYCSMQTVGGSMYYNYFKSPPEPTYVPIEGQAHLAPSHYTPTTIDSMIQDVHNVLEYVHNTSVRNITFSESDVVIALMFLVREESVDLARRYIPTILHSRHGMTVTGMDEEIKARTFEPHWPTPAPPAEPLKLQAQPAAPLLANTPQPSSQIFAKPRLVGIQRHVPTKPANANVLFFLLTIEFFKIRNRQRKVR